MTPREEVNGSGGGGVPVGIGVTYAAYASESQLALIAALIDAELSEPYSAYTYRYFVNNWPHLCFLAMLDNQCIGTIVCKLSVKHSSQSTVTIKSGYIAMLVVDKQHRGHGIGIQLARQAIAAMRAEGVRVLVLETEVSNKSALALYDRLDFVRDARLSKYYLNGGDAFRLKLWLPATAKALDTDTDSRTPRPGESSDPQHNDTLGVERLALSELVDEDDED